ncbi:MAG TPA: RHS repeat-associated core domain-containing protein [Fimbriimonadaceae bacterium]|nr:RHS repeat-associated core domain-containing protein [Fimbriimonadaceae bacterium]HRJ33634.1 RHS repeat-associated core domain-containing protein [Fimbriimonadaceae bacterium]
MLRTGRGINVNGQIVAQKAGSTYTEFIPDPLGNVIACRNSSGTITHTAEYWPYGEVRTRTGFNPSPWAFCGTWGYRQDPGGPMSVRARYYRPTLGRWQTVDPFWPFESAFGYAQNHSTYTIDPSGAHPCDHRTHDYCRRAVVSGNDALRCI